MSKPIQHFSNNNSNPQGSDSIYINPPNTIDSKSPGSISKSSFSLIVSFLHIYLFLSHLALLKYILIAPDLTKRSIVQRLQRQSSVVLPRKKLPITSNQLTLQRPIHRGTKNSVLFFSSVFYTESQSLARVFFFSI